ncbi:MAG: hypothetical protein BGO98_24260 [Myxococcales bacterium 68-20]|nr:MAG: hypothetical protein BGO98_24260 [Myxococcales bacterium 68-20]
MVDKPGQRRPRRNRTDATRGCTKHNADRDELGAPPSRMRSLPIANVVPGMEIEGPILEPLADC